MPANPPARKAYCGGSGVPSGVATRRSTLVYKSFSTAFVGNDAEQVGTIASPQSPYSFVLHNVPVNGKHVGRFDGSAVLPCLRQHFNALKGIGDRLGYHSNNSPHSPHSMRRVISAVVVTLLDECED